MLSYHYGKKKVLEELGGYDENLSYEDYDFFVRSSREYRYFYIDKPLTLKREVSGSDSSSWYKKGINNTHLPSTLLVCKKALWLCRNKEEKLALLHSIRYHFRQAYFLNVFELVEEYYELIGSINEHSVIDKIILNLARKKISLYAPYLFYLKIRKGTN